MIATRALLLPLHAGHRTAKWTGGTCDGAAVKSQPDTGHADATPLSQRAHHSAIATMSVSSSADRDDVAILPRAAGSASQPGGKSPVRRGSVASPAANRRRFIEGTLLLVCVNVIWVGASVLVQVSP